MSKAPRTTTPPDRQQAKDVREVSEQERAAQTKADPNLVKVRAERQHRVTPADPDTHKMPGDVYETTRLEAAQLFASGIVSYVSKDDEDGHYAEVSRQHADGLRSRRISTG